MIWSKFQPLLRPMVQACLQVGNIASHGLGSWFDAPGCYNRIMNLALNPEIERRIAEQVRLGRFPSPEALVEAAVAEFTSELSAQSLTAADVGAIEEADAQIDRGEGIDLATLRTEMSKRFAKR